jgi:hypothetical protein
MESFSLTHFGKLYTVTYRVAESPSESTTLSIYCSQGQLLCSSTMSGSLQTTPSLGLAIQSSAHRAAWSLLTLHKSVSNFTRKAGKHS